MKWVKILKKFNALLCVPNTYIKFHGQDSKVISKTFVKLQWKPLSASRESMEQRWTFDRLPYLDQKHIKKSSRR